MKQAIFLRQIICFPRQAQHLLWYWAEVQMGGYHGKIKRGKRWMRWRESKITRNESTWKLNYLLLSKKWLRLLVSTVLKKVFLHYLKKTRLIETKNYSSIPNVVGNLTTINDKRSQVQGREKEILVHFQKYIVPLEIWSYSIFQYGINYFKNLYIN